MAATLLLVLPLVDRRWPLRARLHLAGSEFLGFGMACLPWALARLL